MGKGRLIDISHTSDEKGSITISVPKKVADLLDLQKGDVVVFKMESSEVVLEKLK